MHHFPHITFAPVLMPVGAVTIYLGQINQDTSSPPSGGHSLYPIEAHGWMVCDGRLLKASQYGELFSSLGYLYGGSDDEFKLPDLQGVFLRGVGTDKASNEKRKDVKGNDSTGIGSRQDFALQTHTHKYQQPSVPKTAGESKTPAVNAVSTAETEIPSKSNGAVDVNLSDLETRPVNIFVYYLIKYTSCLPALRMEVKVQ